MPRLTPEDRATKWSLLVGYNPDSNDIEPVQMEDTNKAINTANYVWDTTTLAWVKQVQNVLVTDSIYLAVDGVEDLLAAANTTYLQFILASVEMMDDWDESNRCKVNPIVGVAGVAAGSGVINTGTQRITIATDDVVSTGIAALAGGVDSDFHYQVDVIHAGSVESETTTVPLGANSTWTSADIDLDGYVGISIMVNADKSSATTGWVVEFSPDGTNWDIHHAHTYTTGEGESWYLPAYARYCRIKFTNGVQAQSWFRLYTYLFPVWRGGYSAPIGAELDDDDTALVVRSVIAGETTAGGGAYVNVKVNPSGSLEAEVSPSSTTWAVQWSEGLTELQTLVAQLDTDFGALLVYAEAHDTDFGTMISHLSAIQTAVQIMDDWDLNDRCRVSPITGQDGVQGGEGAINALTQRVTIATDDDMVADMALLRQEVQDHKFDYYLDGWLVDGDTCYTAVVDKAGNYIITKYDGIAGTATYYGGAGGVPSNTGWAALAYDTYDDEF